MSSRLRAAKFRSIHRLEVCHLCSTDYCKGTSHSVPLISGNYCMWTSKSIPLHGVERDAILNLLFDASM